MRKKTNEKEWEKNEKLKKKLRGKRKYLQRIDKKTE